MKRNSKKWIWLSVVAVVLAVAVVGTVLLIPRSPKEPVYVYDLSIAGMVGYNDYSNQSYGTVTTDRVQSVFLTSTQTVTGIMVHEGQRVNKGAVLYTYDTTLSSLTLERKKLSIQQMELNLTGLQQELKTINGYKPISVSNSTKPTTKPTTPPQTINLDKAPSSISGAFVSRGVGDGTASKPMYYWVQNNMDLAAFIDQELVSHAGNSSADHVYVVFQMSKNNAAGADIIQELGVVFDKQSVTTPEPPVTDPTDPSETTEPSEATEPSGTTEPSEATEPSGTTDPAEQSPSPAPGSKFTYQVASFFVAPDHGSSAPVTPPSSPSSNVNWNSGYTSTEIAAMKAEKQQEIKELQFEIRMAKAEYKIMENEADDGKVLAQFDGVVTSVGNPETAFTDNQPLMKISGGGGYYVEGSVSELALDTIALNQEVQLFSWMTGTSCTGTITEIGQYPTEDTSYGVAASYYPYKVFVSEDANLTDGDYVEMTLSATNDNDALYLGLPFIRTENGQNYVYLQNSEGLLEKRQVVTGSNLWGSYVEICSGLTETDLVAFPYGKAVREGAPTELGTWETLYN